MVDFLVEVEEDVDAEEEEAEEERVERLTSRGTSGMIAGAAWIVVDRAGIATAAAFVAALITNRRCGSECCKLNLDDEMGRRRDVSSCRGSKWI